MSTYSKKKEFKDLKSHVIHRQNMVIEDPTLVCNEGVTRIYTNYLSR